ncbi:pyrroloquinoline quinone biosynthesis peptide chaperone PqqD [Pseudosulfitobacter koreensis]|uniref:Pyrroloquinoline quinone biosynthesis peptide chaperone PqqD n=1 Tax=Pseudosulfitobacter koreensis TaxID=2968472 RepID=A0ABT1YZN3_9RHOB|nr:pyrroloquinoline quinone biosynthesis peptide chaperone PqqD [Pseudosulfitobacter koreense]MCR8826353.1 pyrroloquinoline quinone biosynthesis peptide chaperone PqqD [Pseudosulfitobacter koreense]
MTDTAPDIDRDAVPKVLRGVRLHDDKVRRKIVLLAPERVIDLDPIGLAIMQQIDGQKSLRQIIDRLASLYDAPAEQIGDDVKGFIKGLVDRRILELKV